MTIKHWLTALLACFLPGVVASCSDGNSVPEPDPVPEVNEKDYHFDIWVALDRHGGMGRDVQTLVRSVGSLEADQPMIDFEGNGTEVNSTLTLETIYKDEFYYQVPVSGDRFAKYRIEDNRITPVAAQRFVANSFSPRKYSHAWLDNNTLLILAANGKADKIIWTKLNADDMTILSEGTLDLQLPQGAKVFTTSGILAYRKADDRLFYFFYGKSSTGMRATSTPMHISVINATTMAVESDRQTDMADEMGGSAYGNLLQNYTIVDDDNNVYLAAFSKPEGGSEVSRLLKIPAGSTDFDPNYNGFTNEGKLLSMLYLGNSKAIVYARDDEFGTSIDSYSHYYAIIDLKTCTAQRLGFNGIQLPYSGGRFSTRLAVAFDKAFIGINPESGNPVIYIYDLKSGSLTKGAEMKEGYYFEHIRVLKNNIQSAAK